MEATAAAAAAATDMSGFEHRVVLILTRAPSMHAHDVAGKVAEQAQQRRTLLQALQPDRRTLAAGPRIYLPLTAADAREQEDAYDP
jgi:hypothetical protein